MSCRPTFQMLKFGSRVQRLCRCYSDNPALHLKRALIFSKLSRYEFERYRNPKLDEVQLECLLRKRGSDYDMLLKRHNLHKDFESIVVKTFEECGIETRVVNRFQYDSSSVDWCDIVVPTGGDGTFLLAAGRVLNSDKPVVGLNSDPNRSTGHLCLPKKYSKNVRDVVAKLQNGQFDWKFRSRIRITLCGEKIFDPPVELHDQELVDPEYRFFDCVTDEQKKKTESMHPNTNTRVLPMLALNEVFIGECLSARVSYFEMRLDGGQRTKVKSSGLCVCTGTGSTSWHLSINRVTEQTVSELLSILGIPDGGDRTQDVLRRFNDSLVFRADDSRMGYTVRDLISDGAWPSPKGLVPRGHATNIEVRSRCFNAGLVIDGGVSFNFNDGTVAILEVNPSDSLRTLTLRE